MRMKTLFQNVCYVMKGGDARYYDDGVAAFNRVVTAGDHDLFAAKDSGDEHVFLEAELSERGAGDGGVFADHKFSRLGLSGNYIVKGCMNTISILKIYTPILILKDSRHE